MRAQRRHPHGFGALALAAILASAAGGRAQAAHVAVFADPAYVDTVVDFEGFAEAEAENVQASLLQLGHQVRAFSGVSSDAFATALIGQDVLLIPELELGDLAPALSEAARAVIASFVRDGGGLIVQSAHFRTLGLLDAVLDIELESTFVDGSTLQPAAAGTAFAGGPTTLPSPNATGSVKTSLPAGGRAIYAQADAVTVAHLDEGFGQVVFLGWDWFDAAPLGPADGGWLTVLDLAVRQLANRCGNGALDPGERCDDGNQTSGDCCSATCEFEAAGATCQDDGNSCTPDACNGAGTCVHGAPCDDGNSCTDDVCTAGSCSNTIRTGPCDDGNACTSGDTCQAGVCAGAGVSCDDGNSCTTDSCEPAAGCTNAPLAAGSPCDDGDLCGPDACSAAAQCVAVFKKACDSTTSRQKGRFGVVMEWAPEVATRGVDFCVGQVEVDELGGGKQPASNEVQDVVSVRTGRAVLKMKLNQRGRALLKSVPPGNVVNVALRMDIHKADGSASQIRLIQLLKRRR